MTTETLVSPDSETQNPETVTDENAEVVTPETDSQTEKPETPEDPAAKSLKRLERRIDRVTAARYQAEAEREQARQETAQLKARLQQFEQQEEQPRSPQVDPMQLANEIATVREITSRSNSIAKDGEAKFGKAEFAQALRTVQDEAGSLFTPRGTPTAIGEAVLSADEPAALLHYLGTNPDIAAELADLTPVQAARRIARIEIEMSKPVAPKQSNAPRPITPVRASSAASGGLSDDLPIEEWAKRFRALRNS
jgi:hypothetical protein